MSFRVVTTETNEDTYTAAYESLAEALLHVEREIAERTTVHVKIYGESGECFYTFTGIHHA